MDQPVLITDRLRLRPFRAEDARPLHAFFSDAVAMRWWDAPHAELGDTEAFVSATMASDPSETCDFVIEKDDAAIGKCGMWRAPEIGFFVLPAHQRQGIAREALTAVIAHLFAAYPLDRLTADVDPENVPCRRLLTSIGFAETGRRSATICVRGDWRDSVDYALTRPPR